MTPNALSHTFPVSSNVLQSCNHRSTFVAQAIPPPDDSRRRDGCNMNSIPFSNPIPYAFVSGSLRRCGERSPRQCCNVPVNATKAIRRSSRQECVLVFALQQSFTSVFCGQSHAIPLPSFHRPCGCAPCVHVQEYCEAQSEIEPPPHDIFSHIH